MVPEPNQSNDATTNTSSNGNHARQSPRRDSSKILDYREIEDLRTKAREYEARRRKSESSEHSSEFMNYLDIEDLRIKALEYEVGRRQALQQQQPSSGTLSDSEARERNKVLSELLDSTDNESSANITRPSGISRASTEQLATRPTTLERTRLVAVLPGAVAVRGPDFSENSDNDDDSFTGQQPSLRQLNSERIKTEYIEDPLEDPTESTFDGHLAIEEDESFKRDIQKEAEATILSQVAKAEVFEKDEPTRNRNIIILCVALVVLAAIVGLVFGVFIKDDDSGELASAPSPTLAPTIFVDPSRSSDFCSDAVEMRPNEAPGSGTTISSTHDEVDTCNPLRQNGIGVWYSVEGNGEIMSIDTCQFSTFDTQISVFKGKDCGSLKCVEANDQRDSCGQDASQLFFRAEKGEPYHILVHGARLATGVFSLSITTAVDNSQCSNAIEFDDFEASDQTGVQLFGTTKFSTLADDMPVCSGVQITSPGVWYRFRSQDMKFVQARVRDLDARVTIYEGGCDVLRCVAADASGRAMWTAVPGEEYLVFVHGQGDTVGDFSFAALPGGLLRPPPDAPKNIECQKAEGLSAPSWVTSSTDRGQIAVQGICGQQVTSTSRGIWYAIVGTGEAMLASTCETQSGFDTQISIFTGECSDLKCIDGADQTCGDQSSVAWRTAVGVQYFVLVHGPESRVGEFNLTIEEISSYSEDTCVDAISVEANGLATLGSTTGASPGYGGTCAGAGDLSTPAVWYTTTSISGNTMMASTCDTLSNSFAYIQVFTGVCGELECVDITRTACGDQMTVTWDSQPGQVYYIMVFEAANDIGQPSNGFKLWIEEAPMNSECLGASGLELEVGSTVFGATRFASSEMEHECSSASTQSLGQWYKVVGATEGMLSVSACSEATTFSPLLKVFSGSGCEELTCLGVNNGSKCGSGSAVSWEAIPGEEYYVLVQGADASELGNFALSLGVENNFCDTSTTLSTDGQVVLASTAGATIDGSDGSDMACFHDGIRVVGPSVWYKVVGTGSLLEATTCHNETNFDTQLSVYEGSSCGELSCIVGNDNMCGIQSTVSWIAAAGQEYYVLVHGYSAGDFGLSVRSVSNGACDDSYRLPVGGTSAMITMPTFERDNNVVDPCLGTPNPSPTLWYEVQGQGGEVTVDVCNGGGLVSQLSVTSSGCENPTCVGFTADGCRVSFDTIRGEDYQISMSDHRISVSAFSGFPSTGISVIESNDVCDTAFGPLKVGESVRGSNIEAGEDDAMQCGSFDTGRGAGVWYWFEGKGDYVTFHTCSEFTDLDTQISIYSGDSCRSLECLAYADDNCGLASWRSILAHEGEIYHILVSGKGLSRGNYELFVI